MSQISSIPPIQSTSVSAGNFDPFTSRFDQDRPLKSKKKPKNQGQNGQNQDKKKDRGLIVRRQFGQTVYTPGDDPMFNQSISAPHNLFSKKF